MPPGTSSDKAELKPHVYLPDQIPSVWETLAPLLEKSVEESHGMVTLKQLHEGLLSGQATAFATFRDGEIQAVLVLTINQYATYRTGLVIACAGRDLIEAWKFSNALGAWALTQGAVELEAWCRPQVAHLLARLNWVEKSTVMSFDLRSKLQ